MFWILLSLTQWVVIVYIMYLFYRLNKVNQVLHQAIEINQQTIESQCDTIDTLNQLVEILKCNKGRIPREDEQ